MPKMDELILKKAAEDIAAKEKEEASKKEYTQNGKPVTNNLPDPWELDRIKAKADLLRRASNGAMNPQSVQIKAKGGAIRGVGAAVRGHGKGKLT